MEGRSGPVAPRPTLGAVVAASPHPLAVIESGDGAPVVLVHGAMDRAGGLARLARRLRDHRVIRYDRRGYGGSRALGPGRLADHVLDLVDLLELLSPERRAVVIGHSFGGLVALAAARLAPERVAAVAAYEPPTPWRADWPGGAETWPDDGPAAADKVIERAVGAERWGRAPAALRAARRAEGDALLTEMRSLLDGPAGAPPPAIGPVSAPAVLAVGSSSPAWVAAGVADLASRVGAGGVVALEGLGHRAPSTDAAAVARWCESVIRRSVGRAPSAEAGVAP